MIGFWLQRSDYTTAAQAETVSLHQAIELFQTFDWQAEHAAFDASDDERNCPPGLGLDDGFAEDQPDGRLLHICPIEGDTVFFNFHYCVEKKLLGLFPTVSRQVHFVDGFPISRVQVLIQWFFKGGNDQILGLKSNSAREL